MAKWTMTDAMEKRITSRFSQLLQDCNYARHKVLECLQQAISEEDLRSHDAMGGMIARLAESHPGLVSLIAQDATYKLKELKKAATGFLNGFETLSRELDYKHDHQHETNHE